MKDVIYIAELDADVDDVIASEYLYKKGVLREVVCDPLPNTERGKQRKQQLEKLGITISRKIPSNAKYLFVGGALTEVARYIRTHKIEYLVMNGGYVGSKFMRHPLDKFKGKETVRTFNFNCDVAAADYVLKSQNIGTILLVGKNVCHNERNTFLDIWATERDLMQKHHARPTNRQHDMLACREGLIQIGLLSEEPYLDYKEVYPYNKGLKGKFTEWGSSLTPTKSGYRSVLAAIDWKERD